MNAPHGQAPAWIAAYKHLQHNILPPLYPKNLSSDTIASQPTHQLLAGDTTTANAHIS